MEVRFTPEQEAQFSRIASHQGLNAEEFAKNVLLRMIEGNDRFLKAVEIGIDQAERGEFVSQEEMEVRIDRLLHQ